MKPAVNLILADDHHIVREGLRRILEENPQVTIVAEVADGLDLLEKLRRLNPDLVIMDITMPNLSGTEATRRIKFNFPHVKILILSMHKGREFVDHAIAAGADGYLLKEDAAKELIKAINTLMNGDNYISPLLMPQLEDFYFGRHRKATNHLHNSSLAAKDIEIIKLIAEGKTSKEIGEILLLSYRTVQNRRANIMKRLNIKTSADLVRYALLKGYFAG